MEFEVAKVEEEWKEFDVVRREEEWTEEKEKDEVEETRRKMGRIGVVNEHECGK